MHFLQVILSIFTIKLFGEEDQDGRVGGHGTHLPWPTHQKHTYLWNNSHGKLTWNWKNSETAKSARKISVWPGRMDQKALGQDLCPWEGSVRKRSLQVWTLALGSEWVESQSAQPSSGILHRTDKHLPYWKTHWGTRSVGETSTALSRSVHKNVPWPSTKLWAPWERTHLAIRGQPWRARGVGQGRSQWPLSAPP